MPASVVYTFPVELTHAEAGPVIVGTGNASTVTLYTVAAAAVHPEPLVYTTLTVCGPAVFQVTVTELLARVPPAVIVPPPETTHV